jgi:hypothetical protein
MERRLSSGKILASQCRWPNLLIVCACAAPCVPWPDAIVTPISKTSKTVNVVTSNASFVITFRFLILLNFVSLLWLYLFSYKPLKELGAEVPKILLEQNKSRHTGRVTTKRKVWLLW